MNSSNRELAIILINGTRLVFSSSLLYNNTPENVALALESAFRADKELGIPTGTKLIFKVFYFKEDWDAIIFQNNRQGLDTREIIIRLETSSTEDCSFIFHSFEKGRFTSEYLINRLLGQRHSVLIKILIR
jgi:hypothetical protein